MRGFIVIPFLITCWLTQLSGQSWDLTPENIERAIRNSKTKSDPFKPAFHLTPLAGCMGDPNGGIYDDGWYHIFYGLQPFAFHPGGWYWAHARSRDLLTWQHLPPRLTPPFELGLRAIGSGSTIITKEGRKLAFYSQSRQGPMEFWRAEIQDKDWSSWSHSGINPVLTLDHPGLPAFDGFWRDPFVFSVGDRTFLIACADLFEEDYVPVPIFEATNDELTDWEYRGILFTAPKHRYRNLEVPEIRPIEDKWIFMASSDAPEDKVIYFLGDFDLDNLKFHIESEGVIDHSGHYYAQETIADDQGNLFLMAWLPGWDREWLPYYMNEPIKNSNPVWNGCFAIPRKLSLEEGKIIQKPVEVLSKLRGVHFQLGPKELPVSSAFTAIDVIEEFSGDQLEIQVKFDLYHASFVGISLLTDEQGNGGLPVVWSGDALNMDGVRVSMEGWTPGDLLDLQIFIDKKFVELFANGGRYCISRQLREVDIKGKYIALTSLGGTAKLISLEAWTMNGID